MKLACVQMVSVDDVETNLATASQLIQQAADAGARLVCLPENFAFMSQDDGAKKAVAEHKGAGPIQTFLSDCAAKHNLTLVGGSIPLTSHVTDKVFASSLVYDKTGECIAHYDKVHLFDVRVADDEQYLESAHVQPGKDVVVVEVEGIKLALSICYDLRFPELYRRAAERGCDVIAVPAAFTYRTGQVHWEVLLRARAIENLCFVIAPNQGGTHPGQRQTWGHSMIVDYWGNVLGECEQGAGITVADCDFAAQQQQRQQFPALTHRLL